MRSVENDRAVQALEAFRIAIPSWGFANTGTRFGKFTPAAAATTIKEKFGDAGYRGSDGLGERRGAEQGKRSLRNKQGCPESSDSGTGDSAPTSCRSKRNCSRHGCGRLNDVSTRNLRAKLSRFYAQRTLTKRPILPEDCANAIVWLTSDQSSKTTGHVIPWTAG